MKFMPFVEPEDSSPCPQEPTAGPYPESIESSSYPDILFKIHLNIIVPRQPSSHEASLKFKINVIFLVNINVWNHLNLNVNVLWYWSSNFEPYDELHFGHVSHYRQGNLILWYPHTETGPIQAILVRQKWTKYGSRELVCSSHICLSHIPVNWRSVL